MVENIHFAVMTSQYQNSYLAQSWADESSSFRRRRSDALNVTHLCVAPEDAGRGREERSYRRDKTAL